MPTKKKKEQKAEVGAVGGISTPEGSFLVTPSGERVGTARDDTRKVTQTAQQDVAPPALPDNQAAQENIKKTTEFISQREKIASGLIDRGLSERSAQAEATRQLQNAGVNVSNIALPTSVENARERQTQVEGLLEAQDIFGEAPSTQSEILAGGATTAEGFAQIQQQQEKLLQTNRFKIALDRKTNNYIDTIAAEDPNRAFLVAQAKAQNAIGTFALDASLKALTLVRGVAETGADVPFIGDIITGILGDNKEVVNNFKSSLDKRKEIAGTTAQDVVNGYMSAEDGFNSLNELERQLDFAENEIRQRAILSPAVRRSGSLEDIQVTMLQQRQAIFRARQVIAGSVLQEPNPDALALRLQEIKDNGY